MNILRDRPVRGAILGAALALVLVAAVTALASPDTGVWWWPAAAVAGALGGGVLGALFAAEAEGESPDEGYSGDSPADSDPARRA